MFTYGSDGSDESKGGDDAAAAGEGGASSNSGTFSRSPISITFNEFMKLARLAKVVSDVWLLSRGKGYACKH